MNKIYSCLKKGLESLSYVISLLYKMKEKIIKVPLGTD